MLQGVPQFIKTCFYFLCYICSDVKPSVILHNNMIIILVYLKKKQQKKNNTCLKYKNM